MRTETSAYSGPNLIGLERSGVPMKKKLASLGLVATVLVLGWLLMNPQGGDPLAEVGARFQMATGLGDDQYELSELRYFFGAAAKINEEYVDPTRVEPPAMLVASLDRVARLVPEFLYTFDKEQSALRLVVGSEETEISVPALEGLADLTGVARKVAVFLDKTLDPSIERPVDRAARTYVAQ